MGAGVHLYGYTVVSMPRFTIGGGLVRFRAALGALPAT